MEPVIVGLAFNVIATSFVYALHVPLPVVVRVRSTFPDDLSDAEGMYFAFNVFALGVNVPPDGDDHVPPVATDTAPFKGIDVVSVQTVIGEPAETEGFFVNVISI